MLPHLNVAMELNNRPR